MKKTLAVALLAILPVAANTAHSADMELASSTYDWSGAYVGVNAGGALSDVHVERETRYTGDTALSPAEQDLVDRAHDSLSGQNNGFTGGISAGYNWQYDQVVFGIETDLNALSLKGNMKRDITGLFDPFYTDPDLKVTDKVNYQIDAFGTLRGRLGFAVDNIMLYGTGGLAYGHTKAKSEIDADYSTGSENWRTSETDWNLGWTVGAGIEYGIDRWSLGIEYLYVDLLPVDWQSPSRNDLAGAWDADYSFNVLRATGKLRF